MSALRISRPGHPTVLIPLGYSVPRIDRARSGISFTPLTEAIRPFTGMRNLEVPAKPGSKPRAMTVVRRRKKNGMEGSDAETSHP